MDKDLKKQLRKLKRRAKDHEVTIKPDNTLKVIKGSVFEPKPGIRVGLN
jgi:ribosome-associated translation inhibitor RaiA